MPRLRFAVDLAEPDPEPDAVPEPLPRSWGSLGSLLGRPSAPRTAGRRVSTALLADPDTSVPVRTIDGTPLWRVRVASADEMTCTVCGETTDTGRCYRCSHGYDGIETPMVPTLSYLKPDEYELIRRSYQ